jgi:glycerol-3-phosphate dehydrogenase subunit B
VQLATLIDDPVQHRKLGRALKPLVRPGERVGFPAILGLEAHDAVRAELEAVTGAAVFEIPTLPPSVPGIRLYQTLRRLLQRAGVRIETNMEVAGFQSDAGRTGNGAGQGRPGATVEWVETATATRPLRHRARAYVLATGGVLGGGFASAHDGRIWESVFNLPLTVENDRRTWFRAQFLDPRGQPVFQGGVRVGQDFRPLRADGATAYANVWAVGGTLAHTDPILERSMEGLSIATGAAAAEALVAALRGTQERTPA